MSLDLTGGWLVNIGSGYGLEPSGNKPLPESMLTQVRPGPCHHMASLDRNELIFLTHDLHMEKFPSDNCHSDKILP